MTVNLCWDKTTLRRSRQWRCWREEDDVLPCSRSCWSYHGSSSSVTNSSIVPELSMEKQRNKLLCENNGAPAGWLLQQGKGASSRRSCREAASDLGELCCGSTCFLFVFTPTSHVSYAHLPARAHPGALTGCSLCSCNRETWQQRCCKSSTSSIISCALTVHSWDARKQEHFFQTPRRLNIPKSNPREISLNVAKYCEVKWGYHKYNFNMRFNFF